MNALFTAIAGALALILSGSVSPADTLVATRTIVANEVLLAEDIRLTTDDIPDALRDHGSAIGLAARRTIFQGRPIRAADLGPPALVDRNQLVLLVFRVGGLSIETEGRALDRGAPGDRVRVMNLASRTTVTGTVDLLGAVRVGQ